MNDSLQLSQMLHCSSCCRGVAQRNKGLGCSYFFTQVQVGLNSFSIDEFNNLVINNVNCILYLNGLLFLNDVKKKTHIIV